MNIIDTLCRDSTGISELTLIQLVLYGLEISLTSLVTI